MEEFFHIKGDISLSGNAFEAYSDITDDIYASCDIGSKCTFGWALVLESGMISGYESPVFIWYDDKELTHHDMFLWLYGITDAKWLDENGVKSPDDMLSALVDIGYGATYRSGHGFIYNSGSDENIIKASYLYENAPIDNKYKSKILVRTGTFLRGRLNAMSKRRKTSRFGVWQWDDWARDTPTLICDPIDNHGRFFAELVPAWPNDINDRGEYEWDGSFDPETDTTLWTIDIYDTEFGATGDWTEFADCTAREAMEEADDFIAEFITEQNLIGNGPYTLARRNAMSKRRNKTAEITWGEAQEVLDGCVDMAVSNFEELVPDYDYVEDAVSDAIHDAYESELMYSTDQLAMIWACGALDQALQNAWEAIDEVVYDEFYKRVDPDDYRKEGRRRAMRGKMRR